MKKILFMAIGLLTLSASVNAQEIKMKIPASSTGQRIEQDFGLGTISVSYYRPNTRGRKIFGGMEPYGAVWRTGANNATVIKLTDTVQVEGNTLAPGAYALFTIPGTDEWTIIFNKKAAQWGAYAYDEKDDLFRFKVKPFKLANKVETLTLQFADVTQEKCSFQILWENTGVSFNLTNNPDDRILANILEAMKGDKKPYYMSAIWCYNHNRNLEQALGWMQEAEKANPDADNMKYWLARLQLKTGNKDAAIATAKAGLKLAEESKDVEYTRLNKEVLRDAGVK